MVSIFQSVIVGVFFILKVALCKKGDIEKKNNLEFFDKLITCSFYHLGVKVLLLPIEQGKGL